MHIDELPTPALWADLDVLESNIAEMARRLPGNRLRPHVKAHKSTSLAALLLAGIAGEMRIPTKGS